MSDDGIETRIRSWVAMPPEPPRGVVRMHEGDGLEHAEHYDGNVWCGDWDPHLAYEPMPHSVGDDDGSRLAAVTCPACLDAIVAFGARAAVRLREVRK